MGARYINTDLTLKSKSELAPLTKALQAQGVSPIWERRHADGQSLAKFETDRQYNTPAATIEGLLRAIEALNDEGRNVWNACSSREFDLGFECDGEAFSTESEIGADLLRRMVQVRCAMRVTVYRPEDGVTPVLQPPRT